MKKSNAIWISVFIVLLWGHAWASEMALKVQLGHHGRVTAVAFSPDSRLIASGSSDATLKLWDCATGREIRGFREDSSRVTSVAFSPDGKTLLSGSEGSTVVLWEVNTGRRIRSFDGHEYGVTSVAFSPDGKTALSGSRDSTAKLWDIASGRLIRTLKEHSHGVETVAFSPDGNTVLTGSRDNSIKIWTIADQKPPRTLQGHLSWVRSAAFSPDGKRIVSGGYDNKVIVWDVESGNPLKVLTGHGASVESTAFSRDGNFVISGSGDKTIKIWDVARGVEVKSIPAHEDWLRAMAVSPDGKTIASASHDATLKLWDYRTGGEAGRLQGLATLTNQVEMSRDARKLAVGGGGKVKIWDLVRGVPGRELDGGAGGARSFLFAPDSKTLMVLNRDGHTLKEMDVATGQPVRLLMVDSELSGLLRFSADGQKLVAATEKKTVKVLELASGKELYTVKGEMLEPPSVAADGKTVVQSGLKMLDLSTGKVSEPYAGFVGDVSKARFSFGGEYLISQNADSTVMIWNVATGKWLARLISFGNGSWAVVDPEGRFDASDGGDVLGLHWVVDNEPITLAQLKKRFFEPGLLAKVLGYNKEPLREVKTLKEVALFPEVKVTPPSGQKVAQIRLANRGGGIGKVLVLINGKEIVADARGPKPSPDAETADLGIEIPEALLKPGEENTLQVVAWNKEDYLSSRGEPVRFQVPKVKAEPPTLWAIVVGVSKYANPEMNLSFSGKDAADMAFALSLSAQRLFGAGKVELVLLSDYHGTTSDAAAIPTRSPTRSNVQQAFAAATKARSNDILVVYLAGHGVMAGSGDAAEYYYLTPEAQGTDLSDPAVRQTYGVSSAELTEWVKKIPALKQVMVLDTCAAGGVASKLLQKREVPSDQVRSLERLKDRTGFHVLMGAAANRQSLEASRYGQGLLTYALLEGMKGAALREEQFIDVQRLFQHAADEVPRLAGAVGGIQSPLVAAPVGTSFDIGQLTSADKEMIPLAKVKPMILKAAFQDDVEMEDLLSLSKGVNAVLRSQGASSKAGQMVYVDADELPGAWRMTGRYQRNAGSVSVKGVLREGKQKIEFSVTGSESDLQSLAAGIVDVVAAKVVQ